MTFGYQRATGTDVTLDRTTMALAGGTDLLPLHKVGLVSPDLVVDLKSSDLPSSIEHSDGAWTIGALATLSDVEDHAELRRTLPAVVQAVEQAATRQLRNRATVGGNLLQRPRCRYYRDETISCWFDGGEGCPARTGRNGHHAIFDTDRAASPCVAVQPSDLASALVAVGAIVSVRGATDRSVRVEELLVPPTDERRALHGLGSDDIIEAVTIADGPGRRSSYAKAMDRAAWAFALAGVAAVVEVDSDDVVTDARIVASGVASVPWRLTLVEEALTGRVFDAAAIEEASSHADAGATPLAENGYKRDLLRGLTRQALRAI